MSKKNLFLIMLLVLGGVSAVASAATIAYWEFDSDGSDAVGSHHLSSFGVNSTGPALVNPVPNPDVSIPWNGGGDDSSANPSCIVTSGSGFHISASTDFRFQKTQAFTIEGYVSFSSTGTGYLVGNLNATSGYKGWQVFWLGGTKQLGFTIATPDPGGDPGGAFVSSALQLNTTYHIACVYDPTVGANGTEYIYIDGALDATREGLAAWSETPVGGDLMFAGRNFHATPSMFVSGSLDEFRYSDNALTPSEFLNIPEPATLCLFGLGGLSLLVRRKK